MITAGFMSLLLFEMGQKVRLQSVWWDVKDTMKCPGTLSKERKEIEAFYSNEAVAARNKYHCYKEEKQAGKSKERTEKVLIISFI